MEVGSSSKMESTRSSTPGGSSARPQSSTRPAAVEGAFFRHAASSILSHLCLERL